MSDKAMRSRMDFVQEIISIDEDKRTVTSRLIPNPRRYEWKEIDGKQYLYDKLDDVLFLEKVFFDLAKQMAGQPIYFQPQEIDNAEQYVKNRIPLIRARLKGDEKPVSLEDKSEAFLESLADDKLGFVIMSVDLVGSTKLSTKLDPKKYTRLISTTLYEMSEIIPKFHGHVLKYTGDGLIAYFPEPSFITKNDLAIDCALTIRRLVYNGLNLAFENGGYPSINIRIGLDSGEAYITTIGSPQTKQHKDIIGKVVNLAAKIQSLGNSGDILLGDVTERNLHTMWRQICEETKLRENWMYKGEDGKPYKVHKIKFGYVPTSANSGKKKNKMKETPLSLNDFKFLRTKVDVEEIKKFDLEDQFMSLAVELLKEVGQVTAILSCVYRLDEKNNPRKWTRNEAIPGGLMIRISKLQKGFLDQICQNRLEIAIILFRCLAESLINLTYLLKRNSAEIFDEYIEYSLREEKRLLNDINHNIARRGHELPIENRMKRSINQAFQTSSFPPTQVNETKWKPWGEKIYERAKSIGMGEAYLGLFGLPSHAVHGNWQDLITYHLEYENSEFSPKTQWNHPRPHPLFAAALLSAEVNRLYLNKIIPECSDKEQINKLLDDVILRISAVDELHEKFLQKE